MTEKIQKDHTLSVLVFNKPGAMARVTSLFTRRGFNIESISAGKAKEKEMMRMTIVVKADERSFEQIQKQLYKVIDTVKVSPIDVHHRVEREMALIKIKSTNGISSDLFQLVEVFRGRVVDAGPLGYVIEITGPAEKIDAFINLLSADSVIEIARTGNVALNRWVQSKQG